MIHLLTCLLLTFGPYYTLYNSSKLKEERCYSAIWAVGLVFLITQVVKVFLAATILAPLLQHNEEAGPYSVVFTQLYQVLSSVIDLAGIYYIFSANSFNSRQLARFELKSRLFIVATGVSAASALISHLIPIYLANKSVEYTPEPIQRAINSNIYYLFFNAVVIAVYLLSRTNVPLTIKPIIYLTLLLFCLLHSPDELLADLLTSWQILGFVAAVAAALFVLNRIALSVYLKPTKAAETHKRK
jgi:hypothetical protein